MSNTGDLTCEWCGKSFDRSSSHGPTPRFCSRGHRQRAYEARRLIDSDGVRRLQRQAAEALSTSSPALEQFQRQAAEALSISSPALEQFQRQAAEALSISSPALEQFQRQAAEALSISSPALEQFQRQAAEALSISSPALEQFQRQAAEALSISSPALEQFQRQAAEALSITRPALEQLQRQAAETLGDVDLSQLVSLATTPDLQLDTSDETPSSHKATLGRTDDDVALILDTAFKVVLLWLFCIAIAPALLSIALHSASVTKSTADMFWKAKDHLPVEEALEILGAVGGLASIASFVQSAKSKKDEGSE